MKTVLKFWEIFSDKFWVQWNKRDCSPALEMVNFTSETFAEYKYSDHIYKIFNSFEHTVSTEWILIYAAELLD